MIRLFIFLIALLTLTACANNSGVLGSLKPVAPEISLKDFQLMKLGLSEQTYRLRLHIKNPNAFPLPIQNLNYQLFINDKSFATGASNEPVTIPASGEGYLETDVNSNIADVIEGWGQWFSLAKQTLDYKITGDVGVSSFAIPIPFQYADKVDLKLMK